MGRKTIESRTPKKAYLIMPKEEFKQELEKRINIGKELYAEDIPSQQRRINRYGSMGYVPPREELTDEQKSFISRFHKWTDYNAELLKQSFDHPENEYETVYKNTGTALIITGDEDLIEEYRDELKRKTEYLESLVEKITLLPMDVTMSARQPIQIKDVQMKSNKVFIVHGHDGEVRNEAELLVRQLGFEPIVLFKKANMGDTIIEKLYREAKDAAFAIILYTKCDEGKAVEEADYKPRARQNVVFEHGLMCGLLGRKQVVALVEEGVEIPGDLSGVVYIQLDKANRWCIDVAREMKASGMPVDLNKLY